MANRPARSRFAVFFALLMWSTNTAFPQVVSCNITNVETSEPLIFFPTRVTVTNHCPGSPDIAFQTQTAPPNPPGYQFTHWTVNGQRIEDFTGQSVNPVPVIFTNNITAVAHYVTETLDDDADGLADWYELRYFNTLTHTPDSDLDGDGFDIATEKLRGYQPNLFDEIIEGGVARRRSLSTRIIVNTNLVLVTATSDPCGAVNVSEVVQRGTNFALPASAINDWEGGSFIGWFVGTNRVDDPRGLSPGLFSVTVTNNIDLTARYVLATVDDDADGLADWYELRYFNTLTHTPDSDLDGDGFDIATEKLRGYQPNLFDEIIEGGVARRRAVSLLNFVPGPPEFAVPPQDQTVPPGTNVTLSFTLRGIPPFNYQWRINGVNIVGATNATLTISNAQPTDSGSFSVVLGNAYGFNVSPEAVLLVTSSSLGLADDIENRAVVNSYSGVGSGSNVGATHQAGEPNHAGKFGSNSVWLGWNAPATGVASFTTRGSSFDTVLAVYRRQSASFPASVTNLTLLKSDDDRGGYLTSLVQFNAVQGVEYVIAVDGFLQASGNIVLSWTFVATNSPLPVIVEQPISQTVALGTQAVFSVSATSHLALAYQWFVDGRFIAGATSTNLFLPNVQIVDVGNYQVLVSSTAGVVVSDVAFLQINITEPYGLAQQVAVLEKLGDVPGGGSALAGSGHKGTSSKALGDSFGFSSPPARGFAGTQIYSTMNNGSGSALAWFKLQADSTGPLLVTTEGSEFDINFTVYKGATNAVSPTQLTNVTSVPNNGTDFRTRRITFTATSNTVYFMALDGVNKYGKVWLSWALGYQPAIQRPPAFQIGQTSFVNTNTALGTVQWYFNDHVILGQTNPSLALTLVQPTNEGAYTVLISNLTGAVTRDKVYLRVLPLTINPPSRTSTAIQWSYFAPQGTPVQVQMATNLIMPNWTAIFTNPTGTTNRLFNLPQPASTGVRVFRVRPFP